MTQAPAERGRAAIPQATVRETPGPAPRPGWLQGRARLLRGRRAAGRLAAARLRFERSVVALRKAALDHADSQIFVSVALRASLSRIAGLPAEG